MVSPIQCELEPASFWTKKELERFEKGLRRSGPFKDRRGRLYYQVTSRADDNIYGEDFTWREYVK